MNNLCFNRFTLRTDDAKTRRKILRWLALNYRLYEYIPSDAEVRGRFISRKPFPPRCSGVRSGNCATTERCSCGLSLRTYIRSMWKVMSICSGRGTESFFNHLPPVPKRAGGIISISWHTNHPSLSRISGISARPRSMVFRPFSPCLVSIPKPFPQIFTRARSWAVGAAIFSGSFRWLLQTSQERSSPGSPCSGKDRHTPKYAGTASTMRRLSTNGLKTITFKYYATKIQTEGQLYLPRVLYPACGFQAVPDNH